MNNRGAGTLNTIDSDRKVLINCLKTDKREETDTTEAQSSTVLTRLLKGQNPSPQMSSTINTDMLNFQDVTCIKKTELIESGRLSPM